MKATLWTLTLSLAVVMPVLAQNKNENSKRRDDLDKPLVISRQGSYFVGGESKLFLPSTLGDPIGGEFTINQIYVQFQIPPDGAQHVPVAMVHGCCLSSKSWETTPDGRIGWNEYFVRRNHSVYLVEQPSRARSGFDASAIIAVKGGAAPPSQLPVVRIETHDAAWANFRFGPTFGTPFPDGQFPIEAVDEFYKQMVPEVSPTSASPDSTLMNIAALALSLKGLVLMGHSESGFLPEATALRDPSGIKGIISIEPGRCPPMSATQTSSLAKIPTLVMFGDHLGDGQGVAGNWVPMYEDCKKFVQQLKDAGGDAEMMYLPELGIKGNSHMLMQDRNNLDLADLILNWIESHVESR
jgi:pimeloyl-ACP methyl ester carboxylesterase